MSTGGRLPQIAILAAVAALTILAWAWLFRIERDMAEAMTMANDMAAMGMPMDTPWTAADVWFAFAMWTVMMAGMMAPSATPMLLLVARSSAARGDSAASATTAAFGAGYFAIWIGFSAVAALVQWRLHDAAVLSPAMAAGSARVGGAILIAAGLYQLTPLKRACLVHCRSPIAFLMTHWRTGAGGALRMGLHHGAYCLGCCWALMGILFAVGIMNLFWVAAIGVFVLLEKIGPAGTVLSRIAGLALIAAGIALMIR